jgi:putative ABC transport system ATP-binding protein
VTDVLNLRAVTKTYGIGSGAVSALRGVDLTVGDGELVAIMGPSGSGKSTMLTIAGSLEDPTEGEVLICGADVSKLSSDARAAVRRRSIGFVFQDLNLLAGLSAVENIALPLELDGVRARTARAKALDLLAELELADRAAHFPDDLSGGERQRVAIARAMIGDRRLLLADEPTGALDSVSGEAVMRLLRAACKRGMAGVMVTHDAQLAAWADRVVFIRDGRIVDQTAPPARPEALLTPDLTS